MNGIPTRQQVESLKERYPVGTRVVLHHMDDPYAPVPPGTKGTVTFVTPCAQMTLTAPACSTSFSRTINCSMNGHWRLRFLISRGTWTIRSSQ